MLNKIDISDDFIPNLILNNNVNEINKLLNKNNNRTTLIIWRHAINLGHIEIFKSCIGVGKVSINTHKSDAIISAIDNKKYDIALEFLVNPSYKFQPFTFKRFLNNDFIELLYIIYKNNIAFSCLDKKTQDIISSLILKSKISIF